MSVYSILSNFIQYSSIEYLSSNQSASEILSLLFIRYSHIFVFLFISLISFLFLYSISSSKTNKKETSHCLNKKNNCASCLFTYNKDIDLNESRGNIKNTIDIDKNRSIRNKLQNLFCEINYSLLEFVQKNQNSDFIVNINDIDDVINMIFIKINECFIFNHNDKFDLIDISPYDIIRQIQNNLQVLSSDHQSSPHKNQIKIEKVNQLVTNMVKYEIEIKSKSNHIVDFKPYLSLMEMIQEDIIGINLPSPDISSYNILLNLMNEDISSSSNDEKSYEYSKKLELIIRQMKSQALIPNEESIYLTSKLVLNLNINLNLIWEIIDYSKEHFVLPDYKVFSLILKSVKSLEAYNSFTERLLDELSSIKLSELKGFIKDENIYYMIMDMYMKYAKPSNAIEVYNDMLNAGVFLSTYSYSLIIKIYGALGNIDKAFETYYQIKKTNQKPSNTLYTNILTVAIKSNRLSLLEEVMIDMENEGVELNLHHYTCIIKGYSKAKKYSKAIDIYSKLEKSGLKGSIILYNTVLDCYIEASQLNEMERLFLEIEKNSKLSLSNPQLNFASYSTLIKGYAKWRKPEKVIEIYNQIKTNKAYDLDEIIYNTIIHGLLNCDRPNEALEIYNQMKDKLPTSNMTYSILIKINSKLGDVNKCIEIYNEMLDKKINPSLITYTSIIQSLIKAKKIQLAITIFEEVIKNQQPDHIIFNVIINGCVLNSKLAEGCKYLNMSFERNLRLCNDTYNFVLRNLFTNRLININEKISISKKICQELMRRGVKVDYEIYYNNMKMIFWNKTKNIDNVAREETDKYFQNLEVVTSKRS